MLDNYANGVSMALLNIVSMKHNCMNKIDEIKLSTK